MGFTSPSRWPRVAVAAIVLTLCFGPSAVGQDTKWPSQSPQVGPLNVATAQADAAPDAAPAVVFSLVGDKDDFGFNGAAKSCASFDRRGPGDHPAFDVSRAPGVKQCHYASSWTHKFAAPPGGVAAFTIVIPQIFADDSSGGFLCEITDCGCDNAEELKLDGVRIGGFLPTGPHCTATVMYRANVVGDTANQIAGDGVIIAEYVQGGDEFALDYAELINVWGPARAEVISGDGQVAAISNPAEQPLRIRVTSADANVEVDRMEITWSIVSQPTGTTGAGFGPNDRTYVQPYRSFTDAEGYSSAVLTLGDKEGTYRIEARPKVTLSSVPPAQFTITAKKPKAVRLIRESTNLADEKPTYVVSPAEKSLMSAIGVDAAGQKVGPVKSNWSLSGTGNASISPSNNVWQAELDPTKVGTTALTATPLLKAVTAATKDVLVSKVYVRVEGPLDPAKPVDQLDQFLPGGQLVSKASVPLPQQVKLHVLSAPKTTGTVLMELSSVSRHPGIAMNAPKLGADTNPDLYFSGGGASVTVPFNSSTGNTVVTLIVNDYAAYGTLKVTVTTGKKTFVMPVVTLPKDASGNRLAADGWSAQGVKVTNTGNDATEDCDSSPAGSGSPSEGSIGDGLSLFEEYRGFFVNGQHVRTNPDRKDLFLSVEGCTAGGPCAASYTAFLYNLPLNLHFVISNEFRLNKNGFSPEINFNTTSPAPSQRGLAVAFRVPAPLKLDPVTGKTSPAYAQPDNLAGYCFLDSEDHNVIVLPGVKRESPNTTKRVEIFSEAFENDALYFQGTAAPVPLEDDYIDWEQSLVMPGENGILDTDPVATGQFRAELMATCAEPGKVIVVNVKTSSAGADLLRYVLAHETSHGIDIDHTGSACGDMMFRKYDFLPIPTSWNLLETSQIRTHRTVTP
jgi:hypothetical protein